MCGSLVRLPTELIFSWRKSWKTDPRTLRQDTWHFKVLRLCGPSSKRPEWYSQPLWNLSPAPFPVTISSAVPLPPSSPFEEHMTSITVLLSQHTSEAEHPSLLLSLSLCSFSCSKEKWVRLVLLKVQCFTFYLILRVESLCCISVLVVLHVLFK